MNTAPALELPPSLLQQIKQYQARLQREMPGVEVSEATAVRLLLSRAVRDVGLADQAGRVRRR